VALNAYLAQTSRLLHDPNNVTFSVPDLTAYINLARGQIAVGSQCVRQPDTVNTITSQETYAMPIPSTPGVGQAFAVLNIAVNWGTAYQPVISRYTWADFQAYFRIFGGTQTGFPECFAIQGRGVAQIVYLFPIPSSVLATQWDCLHTVLAINSDTDPEAIPYPWTDCIPYYAAYFALINAQRYQEAKGMFAIFKLISQTANANTSPLFTATPYNSFPTDSG